MTGFIIDFEFKGMFNKKGNGWRWNKFSYLVDCLCEKI